VPFDTLAQTIPDELTRLGIIPVPMDTLELHKRKMLARGRAGSRWLTVRLNRSHLVQNLAHTDQLGLHLPRSTRAPWRVRRLAGRVRDALPEAEFTLGYFYLDPYLTVEYGHTSACLAIWNSRWSLVAIASRT
jgi:hypothetical protein